jgi:replication factor C subunit 2/4
VCDEPHPLLIKEMLSHCVDGNIEKAYQILKSLWDKGYSPHDIITNIFRVCRNHQMAEYLKLEYIKVKLIALELKNLVKLSDSIS